MSLLNTLNLTKLSRTVTTKHNSFDCNHIVLLCNFEQMSSKETKIIEQYKPYHEILKLKKVDEASILKQSLKICQNKVSQEYIAEKLAETKLVFILFSRKIPKFDLRDPKVLDFVCGMLLLQPARDFMYLTLICGHKGIGSPLVELSEQITKLFGYSKIKLDSLDSPFLFYLRKGYLLDKGKSQHIFSNEEGDETKEFKNPPENLDDYKQPYIGIIKKKQNNRWIYIGNPERYQKTKWLYIKDGYFQLYKRVEDEERVYFKKNVSESIFKYLIENHLDKKTKFRVLDENGKKIMLNENAGMITKLVNLSKQFNNYIQMTKTLDSQIEKSPNNSGSKPTKSTSNAQKQTKVRTRSYSVNNNRITKQIKKKSKKKSRRYSTSF